MKISIDEAIDCLKKGSIVALPTETVYGLAACLSNEAAIEKIFRLKGRPSENPLIVHISSLGELFRLCKELPLDLKNEVELLAKAFWPGPLSLVLPADISKISPIARANLETCAFRMPKTKITQQIIERAGPLVMPSANLSGRPSATDPEHVEEDFGKDFPVVDGGACQKGMESTVLFFDGKRWGIIRQGSLPRESFLDVLGYLPEISEKKKGENAPLCPGQLFKHYSPKAKLTLLDKIPDGYEGALLGFEGRQYPKNCQLRLLGSLEKPEKIARNLYRALRKLDQDHIAEVVIDFDLPTEGIFSTIRERLIRASS